MTQAFKIVHKLRHYYSAIGFRGVVVFVWAKISGSRPLFAALVKGFKHPVWLRIGTTDVSVFKQVLLERHYGVEVGFAPKVIVDAGANIGLSSVFFANAFPEAKILAIEPEQSNFELLKQNVAAYPQIIPLQLALWSENKAICLVDPGNGNHGFQTDDHSSVGRHASATVTAMTIDALMERFSLSVIDILKVDIEGAEREVFESADPWMSRVNGVMIELHDHLKPGCTNAFEKATAGLPIRSAKGETVVRFRSL